MKNGDILQPPYGGALVDLVVARSELKAMACSPEENGCHILADLVGRGFALREGYQIADTEGEPLTGVQ